MLMQRYTIHRSDGIEEGVLIGNGPFAPETYRHVDRLAASEGAYVVWHDFLKGGINAH